MAEEKKQGKLHLRTYINKDEAGWWVNVDIGEVLSEEGAAVTEAVEGFRVGPWPSRQVAREQMRGGVRDAVVGAVQRHLKAMGGTFERFEVNDG
jgi:hypothetical protein